VALEANWYGIVDVVGATLVAGNDVIGFHFHAAESMADAAAPMTLREQLRHFVS